MQHLCRVILALTILLPTIAAAAPVLFHVTSQADSGPGSLRQAMLDGNALPANDYPDIRIHLPESQAIRLDSDLPVITSEIFEVRGTSASRAVIDGRGHRIFQFQPAATAGMVSISHLVLRNGNNTRGGCLSLLTDNGLFSVDDTRFRGCTATNTSVGEAFGGAINVEGGYLTVLDSEFFDNLVEAGNAYGGAIRATDTDQFTVRDSTFLGNHALNIRTISGFARGGAIAARQTSVSIERNVFRDNGAARPDDSAETTVPPEGGAIYLGGSGGLVAANSLTMNQAGEGGAMYVATGEAGWSSQAPELRNNSFVANVAELRGGALLGWNSELLLRNNSFHANLAPLASSIHFENTGSTVDEILMLNNLVSGSGAWCATTEPVAVSGSHNLLPAAGCIDNSTNDSVVGTVRVQGFLLDTTYPVTRRSVRPFAASGAIDGASPGAVDDDGTAVCPETDGLDNPRAVDGDNDGVAHCDIGAFEWQHEAALFADDFEDRIQPIY